MLCHIAKLNNYAHAAQYYLIETFRMKITQAYKTLCNLEQRLQHISAK